MTEQDEPACPQAVLIGGYAGTGKTSIARALARQTGWALLDKDTLCGPLVETALAVLSLPPGDRDSDAYRTVVRPAEYRALLDTSLDNVRIGRSVIAVAPFIGEFADEQWLSGTRSAVEASGGWLRIVWVHGDADSMLTYLRRRGAARDRSKLTDWDGYLRHLNLGLVPAAGPYELVDNSLGTGSPATHANALRRRLVSAGS
ncbi:MAG TPA: AAA family ATPase [Actinocatenispora sp.]